MGLRLEKRREPSRAMLYLAPVLAVLMTMVAGAGVFTVIGVHGVEAIEIIFFEPLLNSARWQDLGVKAAPMIVIACGLAYGFRANVWNIGAEGQYVAGALAGTWVALTFDGGAGAATLPLMCLAGVLGGMAWAAIPAFLRTRFGVNEILTSLMLTYVAIQLLQYLTRGPWRDPDGFNFPQTRMFSRAESMPVIIDRTVIHLGVALALVVAFVMWFVMQKTVAGFAGRVVGLAPAAARYGGISEKRTIWLALMIGGGLAGLAGIFEATGPFGQLTPQFAVGYGFSAIIVAFLGRLHPFGIILGALVLAVSIVGGEVAQTAIGVPYAAIGIFQAMMLFFLLAVDVLVRYRLVWRGEAHA
ncbi:MAG: ABC transporter permease [Flavobacteriaceae bacterium]